MTITELDKKEEKENKTIAGISTVVILSLLFLLMLFLVFGSNTALEDDFEGGGGVAVSLGEPDAGGPSDEASAPQTKSTTTQEQVDDPLISQDNEDAPVIKKTTKPKTTETPKPKVDSDLSDILGDLENRKKTDGTGSGTTKGNEGKKDGTDGGSGDGGKGTGGSGSGTSSGVGVGMTASLGSRQVTYSPREATFYANGTVKVKVWVNQSGKVLRTQIARGSSNDANLQRIARDLALETKFEPDITSETEQTGYITFTFRL